MATLARAHTVRLTRHSALAYMSRPAVGAAIAATRGSVCDAASAAAHASAHSAGGALRGLSIAYFNGAFSPPTLAHAHIAQSIVALPAVDALWLDAEPATNHKRQWMDETMAVRIEMCERMVADLDIWRSAGVGTLRRDMGDERGSDIELFRTLRTLVGSEGRIIWALGADVVEGMQYWPEKARSFMQPGDTCDGLLVFVRSGWTEDRVRASLDAVFDASSGGAHADFAVDVLPMPSSLAGTSSHAAREALVAVREAPADGQRAAALMEEANEIVLPSIAAICREHEHVIDVYAAQVASTLRR